jgi:hypothetical protein
MLERVAITAELRLEDAMESDEQTRAQKSKLFQEELNKAVSKVRRSSRAGQKQLTSMVPNPFKSTGPAYPERCSQRVLHLADRFRVVSEPNAIDE